MNTGRPPLSGVCGKGACARLPAWAGCMSGVSSTSLLIRSMTGEAIPRRKALWSTRVCFTDKGRMCLIWAEPHPVPGAADVSAEEEIRRVLPVLSSLLREREAPPAAGGTRQGFPLISVDTWRAAVARAVLEAGADIINDISAFAWEPDMLEAVAAHRQAMCLCTVRAGLVPCRMRRLRECDG